jgi:site-specific DNA-methyltransferase (adenine-specific)
MHYKRSKRRVIFRSDSYEWETPQEDFHRLDAIHHFTLDPCATPENAKCKQFYTEEQDGLKQPWHGRVFMNPPYGRTIGLWLAKARAEVQSGRAEIVVCFVPARTGTRWWHEHVQGKANDIEFLCGGRCFNGSKNSAPFDNAVVTFR